MSNKIRFTEAEVKFFLVKYYAMYEGEKVNKVSIVPKVVEGDTIKAYNAKSYFVVTAEQKITDFTKEVEHYLDEEDVCSFLERLFTDLGYKDLNINVRTKMDEQNWEKDSLEESRKANFDSIILEYGERQNIASKTTKPAETKTTKTEEEPAKLTRKKGNN